MQKKTQQLPFPQLETEKPNRKPLKKQKIEEIIDFFSKNVSGKSHSAKNPKKGTIWVFLNIHTVAKYQTN